jgi:DNA mismatch repair ATPase MutS
VSNFKKHISENSGLRFVFDSLKIASSPGKEFLLQSKFLTSEFDIKIELEYLEYTLNFIKQLSNSDINNLNLRLHQLNNISGTLKNLDKEIVLDDIQLFEIKKFSLISQALRSVLKNKGFDVFDFHDLSKVIELLDPDAVGESTFYIYSSYNKDLSSLRNEQQAALKNNPAKAEELRYKCVEIEDKIRVDISKKLCINVEQLKINYERIAHFDVLLAKAFLVQEFGLNKPEISKDHIEYRQLFNPYIKGVLKTTNKDFQSVDICLSNKPVLITGANMSGKTVLLKSLALSQYMFQFGFYVPASKADVKPVDEIIMNIGDTQNELNGLSSYAVEMINVNNIILKAKEGKSVLALIDELARTTNPDEGKMIVNAFIEIMSELNVCSLITTHYSGLTSDCSRLRVKGLKLDDNKTKITVDNINDFMDYSLIETNSDKAPNEAIRIAEILDIDVDFLNKMKQS